VSDKKEEAGHGLLDADRDGDIRLDSLLDDTYGDKEKEQRRVMIKKTWTFEEVNNWFRKFTEKIKW
jgi:hypothetical protein